MTEPWEEAMERLSEVLEEADQRDGATGDWSYLTDLATIRKHIEDLEEKIKYAQGGQYVAVMARIAELERNDDLRIAAQRETIEDQAAQLSDLMDANIYQQGRIDELEAAVRKWVASGHIALASEPETG